MPINMARIKLEGRHLDYSPTLLALLFERLTTKDLSEDLRFYRKGGDPDTVLIGPTYFQRDRFEFWAEIQAKDDMGKAISEPSSEIIEIRPYKQPFKIHIEHVYETGVTQVKKVYTRRVSPMDPSNDTDKVINKNKIN